MRLDANEQDRIRRVATTLHAAGRPVRILGSIAWPASVRETFLAAGASKLPEVDYPEFDPEPTMDLLREAERDIYPGNPIDDWFEGTAHAIGSGARMVAAAGTGAFFEYSRQLYGTPREPLRYTETTPLELAEAVQASIVGLGRLNLGATPPPDRTASDVAAVIEAAVREKFGDRAPDVEVVEELSANALATSSRIRIRRSAMFTDRDARQLVNHEAFVHVTTALNGRAQPDLPVLGLGHPGTTRTQEGLAVLAEFLSGTMELDRLRRLADRTHAVDMAVEGADFIDVYRWYLDRVEIPEQAFEATRRVFRGGTLTGGAPFTKDIVYIFGLLQVSAVMRALFAAGRADLISLLFCGKLDVTAIPALARLAAHGLCRPALFLPPWADDPRFLFAFLTYSTFENRLDLSHLTQVAHRLVDDAPVIKTN
ncbi:MAG: DUF1704 domain-containing protein [Acidimicrobiia bacterium]|nr:DUF1704 domain-containing protein [Acidimicrobiia bacterium]